MKGGFSVQKGGALKRKSQSDPAGDAFGYVESVIDERNKALKAIEAKNYVEAVTGLEYASSFLKTGTDILKHIGEEPLFF